MRGTPTTIKLCALQIAHNPKDCNEDLSFSLPSSKDDRRGKEDIRGSSKIFFARSLGRAMPVKALAQVQGDLLEAKQSTQPGPSGPRSVACP